LWPAPPGTVSIGFRGNAIVALRAVREEDGYYITHMAEEMLPFSPFLNSVPGEGDCAALSQALVRLAVSVPQGYWPLQIALPDPAAIVQVMEFDSLPDAQHEREAIAKFRLEKEFPAMTQMQCSTQDISRVGQPGLLLATFCQREWLECLNEACRTAGLVPGVIDISASHLFNKFYDVIATASGDGVLIFVEQNSWTILIWDGDHRPRFVKSRWLDTSTGKNEEFEHIAQDIERLILSYVLRVQRRKIGGIYLCANAEDRASLAALLDARMKMPCMQLDVTDGFSLNQGLSVQNIPAGVLAAAVARI
jgi:Tfp pilus assembly PilM family ATPase